MKAGVVVGFACLLKLRSGFFGVFGGSAAAFFRVSAQERAFKHWNTR